jgi:hypothetical protein
MLSFLKHMKHVYGTSVCVCVCVCVIMFHLSIYDLTDVDEISHDRY